MREQFPRIESHLPDLMQFVNSLALDHESGRLNSEEVMEEKVQGFFTADMMERVESIAPGWRRMSSYAGGYTLIHVMSAFVALISCPEYLEASEEQQALLKWIILYHDIAKEVVNGQRDFIHAFRSAAIAGGSLAQLGFSVTDEYHSQVGEWMAFTEEAISWSDETKLCIQDNRKLPEIIAGIDGIFGRHSAAALVVKTVLLHLSIDVNSEWPQAAPMTEAEIRQYIDETLLPLLKVMMLVDNDAWALFDRLKREKYRRETLAVFREIEKLV